MKETSSVLTVSLLLGLLGASAPAQNPQIFSDECGKRIYEVKDVTRRAVILEKPKIQLTKEALAHDVHGRITLEVILCRTGHVRNIIVIQGLPYGMTESAITAVAGVKFRPAEHNWHTVSQRTRFEYSINERGTEGVFGTEAAKRLVENVDVIGNRRLSKDEILAAARTRPGELYNPDQVTKDFEAILTTGFFDRLQSRVTTEDGVRGGVTVSFFVEELPLIDSVKFEGLRKIDESAILEARRRAGVDKGATYDPVKISTAIRIIKEILASNGLPDAMVKASTENLTATAVSITFVISNQ